MRPDAADGALLHLPDADGRVVVQAHLAGAADALRRQAALFQPEGQLDGLEERHGDEVAPVVVLLHEAAETGQVLLPRPAVGELGVRAHALVEVLARVLEVDAGALLLVGGLALLAAVDAGAVQLGAVLRAEAAPAALGDGAAGVGHVDLGLGREGEEVAVLQVVRYLL